MKLYDSIGPNPHIVRMFMAEKGIDMPKQAVDLRKGENREAEHLKRNPHGQMPTLELDDGSYLSEITAICEYLEEKNPAPALIGSTPEERAECRMWTRRVDLNICEPLANGYRFGEALKFFEKRIPVVPEASPGLKMIAQNRLKWLNGQMAGKEYLCGKRFTLADIFLYGWLEFRQSGRPAARYQQCQHRRVVRADRCAAVGEGVGQAGSLHLPWRGRVDRVAMRGGVTVSPARHCSGEKPSPHPAARCSARPSPSRGE